MSEQAAPESIPSERTAEAVISVFRELVASMREGDDAAEWLAGLSDDDNLFDSGVLDSFLMLEVVEQIEAMTGELIDFLITDPEELFTLAGIAGYVLSHQAPGPVNDS